jgi:hypothetical protein
LLSDAEESKNDSVSDFESSVLEPDEPASEVDFNADSDFNSEDNHDDIPASPSFPSSPRNHITFNEPDEPASEVDFNADFESEDNPDDIPASPSLPSSPQNHIAFNETDPEKTDNLKVTRVSAIRNGLKGLKDGMKPQGLFQFWKRGTTEDRNQYFEREDERHNEWMEQHKEGGAKR